MGSQSKEGKAEQREGSKPHQLVETLTGESSTNTHQGIRGDPGEGPASGPSPKPPHAPSADSQVTRQDSSAVDCDHQDHVSPISLSELHPPLPEDYCCMSDIPEAPELDGDVLESQWADAADLFGIGSSTNSVGVFFDIEAYFESICVCQSDSSNLAVEGEPFGWSSDQWEETCSNARQCEESAELAVTPEGVHGGVPGCPVSERQTALSGVQCGATQNAEALATHNSTQGSQAPHLPMANQHFTFEGVAQSFAAPLQNIQRCSIPTPPPHEDDWLFSNILKDAATSHFWE